MELFSCFRPSPYGPFAVLWSLNRGLPKIARVVLSRPDISSGQIVQRSFPGSIPFANAGIDEVADRMERFLKGENVSFSLDRANLDLCSVFQRAVLLAEHAIPRGRVSTYKLIARCLNKPSAARAVGAALSSNPFPIIVPCHRAIRSDGTLGGFQGGLEMKRSLLEMEGIDFDDKERVSSTQIFYHGHPAETFIRTFEKRMRN